MARFDVFENEGGTGYLLDVQSDLFSGLNSRVVVLHVLALLVNSRKTVCSIQVFE